jgi:hypothetical protein
MSAFCPRSLLSDYAPGASLDSEAKAAPSQ